MQTRDERAALGIDPILNNSQFFSTPTTAAERAGIPFPLPKSHETLEIFLRETPAYREGVTQLFDEFIAWAGRHNISTITFNELKNRITTYTGRNAEMNQLQFPLFQMGIPILASLLHSLKADHIPETVKQDIVQNLVNEVTLCSPGVYTYLSIAALKLEAYGNTAVHLHNYRAALAHEIAETLNRPHIARGEMTVGFSVHYANAYTNFFSDRFALRSIPDIYCNDCNPAYLHFDEFSQRFTENCTIASLIRYMTDHTLDQCKHLVQKLNEDQSQYKAKMDDFEMQVDTQYGLDHACTRAKRTLENIQEDARAAEQFIDSDNDAISHHIEVEEQCLQAYEAMQGSALLPYSLNAHDLFEYQIDENQYSLTWKIEYVLALVILHRLAQNDYVALPSAIQYPLDRNTCIQLFPDRPLAFAHVHYHDTKHGALHAQPLLSFLAESLAEAHSPHMQHAIQQFITENPSLTPSQHAEIIEAMTQYLSSSNFELMDEEEKAVARAAFAPIILDLQQHITTAKQFTTLLHALPSTALATFLQNVQRAPDKKYDDMSALSLIATHATVPILKAWMCHWMDVSTLSSRDYAILCERALHEETDDIFSLLTTSLHDMNHLMQYIAESGRNENTQFLEKWLNTCDSGMTPFYELALQEALMGYETLCLTILTSSELHHHQMVRHAVMHQNTDYHEYIYKIIDALRLYEVALNETSDELLKTLITQDIHPGSIYIKLLKTQPETQHKLERLLTLTQRIQCNLTLHAYETALSSQNIDDLQLLIEKDPLTPEIIRDLIVPNPAYGTMLYKHALDREDSDALLTHLIRHNVPGLQALYPRHLHHHEEIAARLQKLALLAIETEAIFIIDTLLQITYIDIRSEDIYEEYSSKRYTEDLYYQPEPRVIGTRRVEEDKRYFKIPERVALFLHAFREHKTTVATHLIDAYMNKEICLVFLEHLAAMDIAPKDLTPDQMQIKCYLVQRILDTCVSRIWGSDAYRIEPALLYQILEQIQQYSPDSEEYETLMTRFTEKLFIADDLSLLKTIYQSFPDFSRFLQKKVSSVAPQFFYRHRLHTYAQAIMNLPEEIQRQCGLQSDHFKQVLLSLHTQGLLAKYPEWITTTLQSPKTDDEYADLQCCLNRIAPLQGEMKEHAFVLLCKHPLYETVISACMQWVKVKDQPIHHLFLEHQAATQHYGADYKPSPETTPIACAYNMLTRYLPNLFKIDQLLFSPKGLEFAACVLKQPLDLSISPMQNTSVHPIQWKILSAIYDYQLQLARTPKQRFFQRNATNPDKISMKIDIYSKLLLKADTALETLIILESFLQRGGLKEFHGTIRDSGFNPENITRLLASALPAENRKLRDVIQQFQKILKTTSSTHHQTPDELHRLEEHTQILKREIAASLPIEPQSRTVLDDSPQATIRPTP